MEVLVIASQTVGGGATRLRPQPFTHKQRPVKPQLTYTVSQ